MIKLLILSAIVAVPSNAIGAEECPASLVLNAGGVSTADSKIAQRYATCMSVPWLPTGSTLRAKLAECSKTRPAKGGQKIEKALDWVDHIATQFPGCETHLQIKGSGNA